VYRYKILSRSSPDFIIDRESYKKYLKYEKLFYRNKKQFNILYGTESNELFEKNNKLKNNNNANLSVDNINNKNLCIGNFNENINIFAENYDWENNYNFDEAIRSLEYSFPEIDQNKYLLTDKDASVPVDFHLESPNLIGIFENIFMLNLQ
jgi:hypothetical protein